MPKNYSKSSETAIRSMQIFQVVQGEHASGPLKAFLVSQSASNLLYRKKIRLKKNVEIMFPLLKFLLILG